MASLERSTKAKETLETFITEVEKLDTVEDFKDITAIELKCQAAAHLAFEQVSHILEDSAKTATAKRTELRNSGFPTPTDKVREILSDKQEEPKEKTEKNTKKTKKTKK